MLTRFGPPGPGRNIWSAGSKTFPASVCHVMFMASYVTALCCRRHMGRFHNYSGVTTFAVRRGHPGCFDTGSATGLF